MEDPDLVWGLYYIHVYAPGTAFLTRLQVLQAKTPWRMTSLCRVLSGWPRDQKLILGGHEGSRHTARMCKLISPRWAVMEFCVGNAVAWLIVLIVTTKRRERQTNPDKTEEMRSCDRSVLAACTMLYRIYPKYSDISTPYHTYSKIWTYYLLPDVVPKICWMSGKQCRPKWDAAFCGVSSGSTLFAQACLSEYIR